MKHLLTTAIIVILAAGHDAGGQDAKIEDPLHSPRIQWPQTSGYPFVETDNIGAMIEYVFGFGYTINGSDPLPAMNATGAWASVQFIRNASNAVYFLNLDYILSETSELSRSQMLDHIHLTYSSGIPPPNSTYNIGDATLSPVNLDSAGTDLSFISFFNNAALAVALYVEGEGTIEQQRIVNRLGQWFLDARLKSVTTDEENKRRD